MVWNVKCNFGLLNNQTKTKNMGKLEVGQYWHHPKDGKELLIISKQQDRDSYVCKCTKYDIDPHEKGSIWPLDYDNIIEFGYVLGRHPDNIEQWQPKEGDLVWNKVYKNKAKLVSGQKGHIYYIFFNEEGIECISPNFEIHKNQFEPYTDQDKKIDFSKSGQWLRNAEDGLICTFGELGRESEILFLAVPFGAEFRRPNRRLYTTNVAWQILTPEQINPILEAYKALK